MYASSPACFSRSACESVNMPAVTHASRPISFTPRTISSTRSNDRAVLRLAPRSAHAEARRAALLRRARGLNHVGERKHRLALHARVVVARLRAIRAVLGAAARLHAEQRAELHLALRVKFEVHGARAIDELEQRRVVDGADFGKGPVVAERDEGLGHRGRVLALFS